MLLGATPKFPTSVRRVRPNVLAAVGLILDHRWEMTPASIDVATHQSAIAMRVRSTPLWKKQQKPGICAHHSGKMATWQEIHLTF